MACSIKKSFVHVRVCVFTCVHVGKVYRINVVASDKGLIYGLNRTRPWFEFTVFGI